MENEKKLDILLEEYKITTSRIESFINNHITFYWNGLAIVFGLLAIFKDYEEVLLVFPIVVIIYVGLFLYNYQRTLTNQEYKKVIESKINEICGEKLLFYTELGYDKIEKNNKFVYFNVFSYSILIIISIVSFITYFTGTSVEVNSYFVIITAVILIFLMLFLIIAFLEIPSTILKIKEKFIPEILNAKNIKKDLKT